MRKSLVLCVMAVLLIGPVSLYANTPNELRNTSFLKSLQERASKFKDKESKKGGADKKSKKELDDNSALDYGYKNGRYNSFLDKKLHSKYAEMPLSPIERMFFDYSQKTSESNYDIYIEQNDVGISKDTIYNDTRNTAYNDGQDTRYIDPKYGYSDDARERQRADINLPKAKLKTIEDVEKKESELRQMDLLDMTEYQVAIYEKELDNILQLKDRLYLERREKAVRQFGYDFFKADQEIDLTKAAVSSDYLLGPGDKLTVYIWGKIEQSLELELDRQGRVYLSRIGYVSLMGVRFGDVQEVLRRKLETEFVNFDVGVSMRQVKGVKVFVLGDVEKPGAIDVTSMASVFQVLYAAGGPTKMGSLRSVTLIRNGKVKKTIDLYEYLVSGDSSQDINVQNNDTIYVKPIQNIVQIDGAIKRRGIYEFKKRLNLKQLIAYAGGLSASSYQHRIQLHRIENGVQHTILDLRTDSKKDLGALLKRTPIKNGDSVQIFPILSRVGNYVTIGGNIVRPGRYSYKEGMTISSLLKEAQGVDVDTYLKRADIYRYISEKKRKMIAVDLTTEQGTLTSLKEWDIVKIYSEYEAKGEQLVKIEGAVKQPGEYKLLDNMKVSDLVFLAKLDTFANQTRVEIFRREVGKTPNLFTVELEDIMTNPESDQNIQLQDRDLVMVRLDATASKKRYVTIEGEVLHPGTYLARDGERLSSIIERAGGYTKNAFLNGSMFLRKSTQESQVNGQREVIQDEKRRFVYDQNHLSRMNDGENAQVYQAVVASRDKALQVLEEQLRTKEGRIVLNLTALESFKDSQSDIEVEDGDKLIIPEFPDSIQLVGGVRNPTSVLYVKGKSGHYYINKVGGFSSYADKARIYVFKPNGSVEQGLSMIEPGDTIYVTEEVKIKTNWLKFVSSMADIMAKTATAIATVKILQND